MPTHEHFVSHGWCVNWNWELLVTSVISDAFIAFAFFSISLILWIYIRRMNRMDPLAKQGLICFITFISICGATHICDILTIWYPIYWVSVGVRIAAALASVATVVLIYPTLGLVVRRRNEEMERLHGLETKVEAVIATVGPAAVADNLRGVVASETVAVNEDGNQ